MSKFYSEQISVTDADQTISLAPYQRLNILNIGDNDCQFEFENDVDANSPTLYQSNGYDFGAGSNYSTLHVKCASGKTTTIQLVMTKQFN